MASAVESALAELKASLAVIEPQMEGFSDFYSLDLRPDSKEVIHNIINAYDNRHAQTLIAIDALEKLLATGYPDLSAMDVPAAVYQDLQDNMATLNAALGQVHPKAVATSLEFETGPAEPKGTV